MNAPDMDQIAINIAQKRTRRGALQFLAGATLGGVGLPSRITADTEAKKKRKKGKKRQHRRENQDPGHAVCRPGERLAELRLPNDGTAVPTPVLAQGQRYWLHAFSFAASHDGPVPIGFDAGYVFTLDGLHRHFDTYAGIDFGLVINGETVAWDAYTPDHHYERVVEGRGQALALQFTTIPDDTDTLLDDLTVRGSLFIEIFCG